jgi:hypothetical protein
MRTATVARRLMILAALVLSPCMARAAQDGADAPTHRTDAAHARDDHTNAGRPVLPGDGSWAGALVIVILVGLFLPAAVIGPVARALVPPEEEPPDTHSHEEPLADAHNHHGASGGHGHSGHGHHGH